MKIGFIGLGIMGESMSANIIKKHDDTVYVFDLVKEQVNKLQELGGVPCNSSLELADKAEIIITMLPKSEHSRTVYSEIVQVLDGSKICIDMSTIDPDASVEIAELISKKGAKFLDAPVVKSKPAAIAGKLGIYVGGEEKIYQKVKPILLYMGENVIRMGENGKGLVMKICHNALVAQIQNGVNETLVLAERNDIDALEFAAAISYGGGQNFYLDSKVKTIAAGVYTTAFSIENMSKDVNICMKLANECGLPMPGEAAAKQVYDKAMDSGINKEDFSATIKIVRSTGGSDE